MRFQDKVSKAVRAGKLALAFLTVVPVRFRDGEVSDADVAASRRAYPLVGALIGLALAGLSRGLSVREATPEISAFLLTASGVALTGALHLDGLADTADGLFLPGGPGRRLAVMRDPHVGSFGVAAVVLVLLGKYAALGGLGGVSRAWAMLGAATVARSLVLVSAGTARYARPEGTGRVLIDATTWRDAVVGSVLALAAGWLVAGDVGFSASASALIVAFALSRVAFERLGGVTGDTLGAVVETGELVFLLVVALARSGPG